MLRLQKVSRAAIASEAVQSRLLQSLEKPGVPCRSAPRDDGYKIYYATVSNGCQAYDYMKQNRGLTRDVLIFDR